MKVTVVSSYDTADGNSFRTVFELFQ